MYKRTAQIAGAKSVNPDRRPHITAINLVEQQTFLTMVVELFWSMRRGQQGGLCHVRFRGWYQLQVKLEVLLRIDRGEGL